MDNSTYLSVQIALVDAAAKQALHDVLSEPPEFKIRFIQRWYSREFSTPLHVVEDELDFREVARHFFECRYEAMLEGERFEDLEDARRSFRKSCDPDFAKAEAAEVQKDEEFARKLEARLAAEAAGKAPPPTEPPKPAAPATLGEVPAPKGRWRPPRAKPRENALPAAEPQEPEVDVTFATDDEFERSVTEWGLGLDDPKNRRSD